jgi:hypothetical protein
MSPEERLIREACLAASAELGVRIVTPIQLADADGSPVEFIALFPDFGSPDGTVVCHFRDWPKKQAVANRHGVYCAGLHPDSYSSYDRRHFVDAFEEWGWQGSAFERPNWCRGSVKNRRRIGDATHSTGME